MNAIEIIIILLLLVLAVPDVCRRLGRPALANAGYVLFGVGLGPFLGDEVQTMLQQAGKVGFLLLLFEVGLEIELPGWKRVLVPAGFAALWVLLQAPLAIACAQFSGLPLAEAVVATAALTSCALGMTYTAWKAFPAPSAERHGFLLLVMIVLEVQAIVSLSVGGPLLDKGFSWSLLPTAVGTLVVLGAVGLIAPRVEWVFQKILSTTTHWRIHLLILLVLAICALAQRLGVSAPKAAFFLGLFMSRLEHDGQPLEHYVAPLSQRFLIPAFFVSLGLQVPAAMLVQTVALKALGTAALLLAARQILHRHWLRTGAGDRAWLLFSPNLTMVALAATTFIEHQAAPANSSWLLLTGLFLSVGALLMLPGIPDPSGAAAIPDSSGHAHDKPTEPAQADSSTTLV